MKWQYMKLWDPSEERMNEAGAEGWELVALCNPPVVIRGGSGSYQIVSGGGGGGDWAPWTDEPTSHDDIYAYFKRQLT